jgi:hypothetical protein
MADDSSGISPRRLARIGGVLYLIIIIAGMHGELFVRGALVVSGNAAATANNIIASRELWRTGIAGDLVMHICDVGLMLIFFWLLRPVSWHLAMLALLFNLVQTCVLVANKLNLLLPLFFLGDAAYLSAFTVEQRQALAYVALRTHDYGFGVGLIFFGMTCIFLGTLIVRSGFLPKFLGLLMQLAGVAYLVNSFTLILYPPLAARLFPFILLPPFIGELSLALWMLVKGVDEQTWLTVSARATRQSQAPV